MLTMTMDENICRLCLSHGKLTNIFSRRNAAVISARIISLVKIEIHPDDGLPDNVCSLCITKLDRCLEFIQQCETSDRKLRASSKNYQNQCFDIELSPPSSPKDIRSNENIINELKDDTSEGNHENITSTLNKKTEKQQCFTCGKVMSSRFRLKTHLRIHTGERPFTCPHCGKNFNLAQSLKVHLRVHTGEKPFKCDSCEAAFAHSAGLSAHKRKHTELTPYCCSLCPRKFRTVGHLQYHLRRHTGEMKFDCSICGRSFITRGVLNQHLRTHSGEKSHICCICGLRLSRSSNLKRHIQFIHNMDSTYNCVNCPSKFKHKPDFEKHNKKHMMEITEKD